MPGKATMPIYNEGHYRREFPDFPETDMPAIPDGFTDCSWHNCACPCFASDAAELEIWVDFADPANREFPDWKRFRVSRQRGGIETSGPAFETDDWGDVVAFVALTSGDSRALDDWYAQKVGYRPRQDDPSMTDADLRRLCQERFVADLEERANCRHRDNGRGICCDCGKPL